MSDDDKDENNGIDGIDLIITNASTDGPEVRELLFDESQQSFKNALLDIPVSGKASKIKSYESVHEARDAFSGARIRVWRRCNELPVYTDSELLIVLSKIPGHSSMQDVISIISQVQGVTQVELVDHQGYGVLVKF
jgi:hypothetical protein